MLPSLGSRAKSEGKKSIKTCKSFRVTGVKESNRQSGGDGEGLDNILWVWPLMVRMRPNEKVLLRPAIGSESNLIIIANIYKVPDRMLSTFT